MCCNEELGARWTLARDPNFRFLFPCNRVLLLFLDQPSIIETECNRGVRESFLVIAYLLSKQLDYQNEDEQTIATKPSITRFDLCGDTCSDWLNRAVRPYNIT